MKEETLFAELREEGSMIYLCIETEKTEMEKGRIWFKPQKMFLLFQVLVVFSWILPAFLPSLNLPTYHSLYL